MSYSLFSAYESPEFKVGVVKPVECLGQGWSLIKNQYFLFAGFCLIILVLVSCIPFAGIIWGAWMCGIFLALLVKMRGGLVSFNDIGKGFSHMGPGFVVAFLSGLPFLVVLVGVKLFESWMDQMDRDYPGDELPPEVLLQMITYLAALALVYVICFLITGVIFAFAYQLVVDKNLSGWQATKLSARAAQENFGGVMGLLLLELAICTFGIMLCCFGLVLVLPVMKAAWAIAYSQVFLPTLQPIQAPQPPPPPVFYRNAPPYGGPSSGEIRTLLFDPELNESTAGRQHRLPASGPRLIYFAVGELPYRTAPVSGLDALAYSRFDMRPAR